MRRFLFSFLCILIFVHNCYADVCFDDENAKRVLRDLKDYQVVKELVVEQERAIENLKKQVELYREEVRLLKEIIELKDAKVEIYKKAYEEERGKANLSLFQKGKYIGLGVLIGIVGGLIWLPK